MPDLTAKKGSSSSDTDDNMSEDERLKKIFGKDLFEEPQEKDSTSAEETEQAENAAQESNLEVNKMAAKPKSEYSPQKVKEFLIKLAKAAKRHEIRMNAHQGFHQQVDKLKQAVVSAAAMPNTKSKIQMRTPSIDYEIEELKKKVAQLVAVERTHGHGQPLNYSQDRIRILESKLDQLLRSKEEKEQRFQMLEQKIGAKLLEEKELVESLERKLLILQKKLLEHKIQRKKSGKKKVDPELKLIQEKIEKTRSALDSLKTESTSDSDDI
jgi:hypothetical protein